MWIVFLIKNFPKALRNTYVEYDRDNSRLGLAPVKQCINNCTAFRVPESCRAGGCSWYGSLNSCGPYVPGASVPRLLPLYIVAGVGALLGLIVLAYVLAARRRHQRVHRHHRHTTARLAALSPDDAALDALL